MALQPITRKTMTEDGEQITTSQKMLDAVVFARTKGYYGGLDVSPSGEWRMWLQHPTENNQQIAKINDVFVVQNKADPGAIIKLVPLAQYSSIYNLPA